MTNWIRNTWGKLRKSSDPVSLDGLAVITPARDITHRQLARDIAAARQLLRVKLPSTAKKITLAPDLHGYLAWLLRVASLVERKQLVQMTERTPPQDGAFHIAPPMVPAEEYVLPVAFGDLKDMRGVVETLPVWSLLAELSDIDDCVVTIYTSGSTGAPKGVGLSGKLLTRRMGYGASVYRFQPSDIFLCKMGPDTVGGFYLPLEAWKAGAALVIEPVDKTTQSSSDRIAYRSTVVMASTAAFNTDFKIGRPWSGLEDRRVYLAGSRVQTALVEKVGTFIGRDINVVYGSTECGASAYMSASRVAENAALVGTIMPGTEIKILDSEGKGQALAVPGEIAIRAEWGVKQYQGDVSPKAFRDGWFFPGDLGYVNEHGDLFVTGRTVETLNYSGEKFLASDLETRIVALVGVDDAFVTVVNHNNTERLIIMVATSLDPTSLRKPISACLDRSFAYTLVPVSHIPRNHMGKLERQKLTESLAKNLTLK